MDPKTMDQGLLKRNPAMTPEEFSHHWFTKHAPLVVPFFLHSGITHYEQIHGPLIATSSIIYTNISTYDGAVPFPSQEHLTNSPKLPKWKEDYYREVILVDERRFLVSEALEHIFRMGPGSVKGEKRVIIEEGKCLIEIPEEVERVWRRYLERGKEEAKAMEE